MIDTSAGFVAIPRGITSWEWYDDPNTCRLFFHLMLTVNYQSKEWRGIAIEAGGRVASLSILAEETGLTVRNVRTSLERLEATSYVTIKKTNKYSIVTINNYMSLTGIDKLNDKQTTRKRHAKRHAKI